MSFALRELDFGSGMVVVAWLLGGARGKEKGRVVDICVFCLLANWMM